MEREVFDGGILFDDLGAPASHEPSKPPVLSEYPNESFPCSLDVAVLRHLSSFARAEEPMRAAMCESPVSPLQREVLLRFAERMARVAVLEQEVRLVQAGLVALILLGRRTSPRAIWRIMALLHASAEALTSNPDLVFREVCTVASAGGIETLLEAFVHRDSDGRVT